MQENFTKASCSYRSPGQNLSFEFPFPWNIVLRNLCLKCGILLLYHLNTGQGLQDLSLPLCKHTLVQGNKTLLQNKL